MKRIARWIGGVLAVLILLVLGYRHLVFDMEGQPVCHKQIMFGFTGLMHPAGGNILLDPKPFPNVDGLSQKSLTAISDTMAGYTVWTNDYNYVPGLCENDPPDLVLMYFKSPTRWIWHGMPRTIFSKKQWMIVPVDFGFRSESRPNVLQGECSEIISLDQFRIRLRRTLDFVRTNERPHWQTVVSEHEKFLKSIEDENQ